MKRITVPHWLFLAVLMPVYVPTRSVCMVAALVAHAPMLAIRLAQLLAEDCFDYLMAASERSDDMASKVLIPAIPVVSAAHVRQVREAAWGMSPGRLRRLMKSDPRWAHALRDVWAP